MSMDKPIAMNSGESTKGLQVKNKIEVKKEVPRACELKYEHVHEQTDTAE